MKTYLFSVLIFATLHGSERDFQLINGKTVAQQYEQKLKDKVTQLKSDGHVPSLAVIMVGSNPASKAYVTQKQRACQRTGIDFTLLELQKNVSEETLKEAILDCNNDETTDGLIVQLPLPDHINTEAVLASIDPSKDVDGLHPFNMGKLKDKKTPFIPATPLGILKLLKSYRIPTEGKHCVVVGGSKLVGHPLSVLLSNEHKEPGKCTVTLCNKYTTDLAHFTKDADILITAVGKPHLISKEMIKEGAVVIDAGFSRVNSKMMGDVEFEGVKDQCSAITPVPGGVGPMTVTSLLLNTVKAAKSAVPSNSNSD